MNQLVTLTASNNALPLIGAAGDRAAYRFLEYSSPWDPLLPSSEQVLTSRIYPERISGLTTEQGSMDPTYNLNGGFKPTMKRFADLDGPDFFPTPAWATHALLENEHVRGRGLGVRLRRRGHVPRAREQGFARD